MIIGLAGKAGAGKNLCASIIQYLIWKDGVEKNINNSIHYSIEDFIKNKELGYRLSKWKVVGFADKLKDIISIITGCKRSNLDDQKFKSTLLKNWNYTPRELLQCIGTGLFRNQFDKNVWVNALMNDYDISKNWLISDVRFPNELKAIKDRGGICIRVFRDLHNGNVRIDTIPHESELALDGSDGFDYTIINDGTIDDLVEKVKNVLIKELPYRLM